MRYQTQITAFFFWNSIRKTKSRINNYTEAGLYALLEGIAEVEFLQDVYDFLHILKSTVSMSKSKLSYQDVCQK